jgi:hypothetical protein
MGNIQPAGLTELPPLIYRTTDPRVVKAVMRQAALSLTGSGMDEDQLNSAATTFNALERKRDRDMYNAQYVNPNPKGTTVVDAPSVEAFADQYLRDTEPGEVEEHAGLGFAQDAMTLLTSPAWGS